MCTQIISESKWVGCKSSWADFPNGSFYWKWERVIFANPNFFRCWPGELCGSLENMRTGTRGCRVKGKLVKFFFALVRLLFLHSHSQKDYPGYDLVELSEIQTERQNVIWKKHMCTCNTIRTTWKPAVSFLGLTLSTVEAQPQEKLYLDIGFYVRCYLCTHKQSNP